MGLVTDRSRSEKFYDAIAAELNQERAAVLGKYGRRVEDAIARAEALLEQLDPGDPRSVDTYRSTRREALQAVSDLCLQREMLGLLDHTWVDRIYRIPPHR